MRRVFTENTARHNGEDTKSVTITNPQAVEDLPLFPLFGNLDLIEVQPVVQGTDSPAVQFNLVYAATRQDPTPTKVWTVDPTCSDLDGLSPIVAFDNHQIPSGSWVGLVISGIQGTVHSFHLTLRLLEVG